MNVINEIKNLIEKHDKIALFHHTMPDGDSISSSYALLKAIQQTYPNKKVVWLANTDYLKKRFWYLYFNDFKDTVESIDESYLGILGDCSDPKRTYKGEELKKAKNRIIFDHHQNKPSIESNIFWHEPSWPASAMQSYLIAKSFVKKWNEDLAILFYFGIMTDTGRFAYSLANSMPLEISSELFKYISDNKIAKLYQNMQKREIKDVKFEGWVLENFKVNKEIAYLKISKNEQEKLGIEPDDCAKVNLIANIENIKIWIFFIEYPDFIRVEFRSLGIPVNEIAQQFNGGGHIKAAGCHLTSMEEADKVIDTAIEAL